MKTFLWGAAVSAGLVALVACGGEDATPVIKSAPAEAPAAVVKAKVAATIVDPSSFVVFMVVPKGGDTGAVTADGSAYEIRSSNAERVAVGDGDGVLVRVQPDTAAQLGGRNVRVSVTARSSATNGSPAVNVMYFRPGTERGSGWQEFPLSTEFATYTFEYLVPGAASTSGFDNIGFWADAEGKGRGVEVSTVMIETID